MRSDIEKTPFYARPREGISRKLAWLAAMMSPPFRGMFSCPVKRMLKRSFATTRASDQRPQYSGLVADTLTVFFKFFPLCNTVERCVFRSVEVDLDTWTKTFCRQTDILQINGQLPAAR